VTSLPLVRLVAIAAAAALAGGCGRSAALPSDAELPIGPNQDCGCVRDGRCATIEAAPGWSELRNVSCRWIDPGGVARCNYEERRVDHEGPEGGGRTVEISSWRRGEVVARRHRGEWCAETAI
jgi:hypothetical protein